MSENLYISQLYEEAIGKPPRHHIDPNQIIWVAGGTGRVSIDKYLERPCEHHPISYHAALSDLGTSGMNILTLSSVIPAKTPVIDIGKLNLSYIYYGAKAYVVQAEKTATEKGKTAVAGISWIWSPYGGLFAEKTGETYGEVSHSLQKYLDFFAEKERLLPVVLRSMHIESVTCRHDNEVASAVVQALYNIEDSISGEILRVPVTTKEVVDFNKRRIELETRKGRDTYIARKCFHPGEIVLRAAGEFVPKQSYETSIQVSPRLHLEPHPLAGAFIRHSCGDGEVFPVTDRDGLPVFLASRKIERGEEIRYNYASTELSFGKNTFEREHNCNCGSKGCDRTIHAFSELNRKDQQKLIKSRRLSNYLLN